MISALRIKIWKAQGGDSSIKKIKDWQMESGYSGVPGQRLRCEDTGDSGDQAPETPAPVYFILALLLRK